MTDQAHSTIRSLFEPLPSVRLVYLFGSRAAGRATPESDFDVALLAEPPLPLDDRLRMASELAGRLGCPVDLVPLERAPIELAWAVVATGELVLERSVAERVEYEATIQSRYGDHLPVLRAQRADIVSGGHHEAGVRRYRAALGAFGRLHREARGAGGTDP